MPDTDKPKSAEPTLKQPTWRQRDYTATATMGSNEAKVLIAPDGVEYGPMFPGTADGLESRIADTHQALLDTVAALEWYKTEAEAIKRNMERKNEGTTALTASMQVLALDGGKRAEAALARAREVVGV